MRSLALLGVGMFVVACGKNVETNMSDFDAYNAGKNERHLVIAAPLGSPIDQRLWVCRGDQVESGTNPDGYKLSIGIGKGVYADVGRQTTLNRNRLGSNLTPVGELKISQKIPSTCGKGMVTRCMQLDGIEQGINQNTVRRSIYIHGTPAGNYKFLGDSASHGCVRMTQTDVRTVYDLVSKGTRVYINSDGVNRGSPCHFTGEADGGKAR